MIIIRLKKLTGNNNLTYALVVTSTKEGPKSNNYLEKIGSYRPIIDKWSNKYLILNVDRLQFWLKRGAKMNNVTFFLAKPLIEVRQNIRKK